ncbi:ABC-type transport system ATP-binding protein (probable substrate dipeptides/oligopeptides) [Haladaptatus paucihalophilus DX253]|uniref:Nickel import system ATP-binding protein NikD n=1 Tax=Haladaptatus paucihalophilus DX253 TaxID=797209 RepID=E7QZ25_HALPU|nr:dipeptide ABC transporter ATP-binding protein [Haladaptatus paucihalophilus]EFW90186.1 ABC-type transport system ATP-binding protein (probable substrate dipeptides/oligopeptides) [Haladaptatus paucihalophilus DX253]SHL07952.1 peptide/nickel transport system ATP-binding protein [Haladaptatus paucihalophilus DX253]
MNGNDADGGSAPLLDVRDLRTEFLTEDGTVVAANDVSFALDSGETMGLVGESGAGKSVTARSLLQLVDSPGEITGGEVVFDGVDLLGLSEPEMRSVRGNKVALIPQDPMSSLNPVLTVGEQIVETILHHQGGNRESAREQAIEVMRDVEIPDAAERFGDYPHEFSGGMRQRVLIAIGLSCKPDLIIADEPTTALDVTTQAKILDLLNELQEEKGMAILMITHNLGVVAQTCDHVGVMYAGNLVETAELDELFDNPQHPYTRGLIDSIPQTDVEYDDLPTLAGSMPDLTDLPSGCNFAPRCEYATEACRTGGNPRLEPAAGTTSRAACIRTDEIDLRQGYTPDESSGERKRIDRSGEPLFAVKNLKKHFPSGDGFFGDLTLTRSDGGMPTLERRAVKAVDGIDFEIYQGETVGLVGESGCGKSTVARTALKLLEPTDGEVYFEGQPIHEMSGSEVRSLRREMQMIFQDPQSSLNPRKTVGQIIGRAMEKHDIATGEEKRERTRELLTRVGLSPDALHKYPHQFSGGQQQRIAIAHALAVEPKLIVCDEPVSALDVSVQAQILNLLDEIQAEYGLSYLFISHNIGVVRHICDRIAVMYLGKIAEFGTVEQVFSAPFHPYTESLLSAVPHANPSRKTDRILLEGSVPSPLNPPSGCPFQTRCPKKIGDVCEQTEPTLEEKEGDSGHQISCHLSVGEMSERRSFVETAESTSDD